MLADSIAWWLIIEAAGLIALPVALLIFRRSPGLGYALAKPLGLLLGGYLFWLSLSFDLLSNRPGSAVLCFIVLSVVSILILRRQGQEMLSSLQAHGGLALASEAVFCLGFTAAVYLRSFVPAATGTEKPMDLMLLNAAYRSQHYPPADAWLAGADVSYYYFGYVIQAMTARLSAVAPSVAFNLGLASTAALAASAALGLGAELASLARRQAFRLALFSGALAALALTILGNLEGVVEFLRANGRLSDGATSWLGINGVASAEVSKACLIDLAGSCLAYPNEESSFWWWWRATRISADGNSITEFPFFSFLLGDLHPHVMALPYVLLALGFSLSLWLAPPRRSLPGWPDGPAVQVIGAVILGALGFLNTWDLPTGFAVLSALLFLRHLHDSASWSQAAKQTAKVVLPMFGLALLLYAPFYFGFSSQASGLETVVSAGTRPLHGLLFWGPLLVLNLPLAFAALASIPATVRPRLLGRAALLPLSVAVLWLLLLLVSDGPAAAVDAVGARGWNWLVPAFLSMALAMLIAGLLVAKRLDVTNDAYPVALVLAAIALLLILGAEFFYVDDVFASRLNTVFKLYYQAWLLLAISAALSLSLALRGTPNILPLPFRRAWAGAAVVIVGLALLYPLGGVLSRSEGLQRQGRTLDGLAFMARQMPEEYLVLNWLRKSGGQNSVILEATGGPYSDFARISARTGVPAVIGWPGHEVQWGRDGAMVAQRQADADLAFSTASLAEALPILRKYGVTYVFIGGLERSKYPAEGLNKFLQGLPTAFGIGETVLLRVPAEPRALAGGVQP